jgi:hypothetical protein
MDKFRPMPLTPLPPTFGQSCNPTSLTFVFVKRSTTILCIVSSYSSLTSYYRCHNIIFILRDTTCYLSSCWANGFLSK